MDKNYVAPGAALRKLRASRGTQQKVYIYGATGFGKTELVKQYLANRRYQYYSCTNVPWSFEEEAGNEEETDRGSPSVVVVDDLHLLKSEAGRHKVMDLATRKDTWLILIARCPVPPWLMPYYVNEGFMLIGEEDLRLGTAEIGEYLSKRDVTCTEEELECLCRNSMGNAYVLHHVVLRIKDGRALGADMVAELHKAFSIYLENHVMVQWDSELLEFLMQVSVVGEFTLGLAEMITGNCRVSGLLDRAMETGNFLFRKGDVYWLRPELVQALQHKAAKVYGTGKMADFAYNAGLYYEMHDQIVPALKMFELCSKNERIKGLLVRNARLNPSSGHYYELRQYYFRLKEADVEGNAVLMAGLSMLYSLLMKEEESEYWYQKLKIFVDCAKGGEKREALSWLVYLDIALPHRGSMEMIEIMKKVPALLFDKGISLPEFSVTSNYPSTMNGGKDFCHWSKNDRKLADSIGKLVEKVLGSYGKGMVKAALGESLYEKGEDTYEVLALLTSAQLETEGGGRIEMTFVTIGLQIRLNLFHGELRTAKEMLASFERKVKNQGADGLLPNIAALRCRMALYEGDKKTVEEWMKAAPDENMEFYVLNRYCYLTKVRCYIAGGHYLKAQMLLEKLRYYTVKCRRTYIRMEVNLLSAMVKRRMGTEWKKDFMDALAEACEYRFLRIISEEGAAAQELLEAVGKSFLKRELPDKEWLSRLMDETRKMSVRYPVYLKSQIARTQDFSEKALDILRLQAKGLSVNQIAERMGMKAVTVKYHTQENYRKLGVSGKADAVLAARNLGIL